MPAWAMTAEVKKKKPRAITPSGLKCAIPTVDSHELG
jgi:hypothetical protein